VRPGEVHHLLVRWPGDEGAREKFFVCIDAGKSLFLCINTNPPHAQGAGVLVTARDLSFLSHDSYIDTGKLHCLDAVLLDAATQGGGTRRGRLPASVAHVIKAAVRQHGLLPPEWEDLVLSNL